MKLRTCLAAAAALALLAAAAAKTKQPRFLFGSALAFRLTREQLQVDGTRISVLPAHQSVTIEPLPVLHDEFDGTLTSGTPGWRGDFLLPKVAWVYRGLRPGSLKITLVGDAKTRLARGRDYLIDTDWASVNAAPSSRVRPGARLHFAYDYTPSRLDLIEQRRDGALVVKKGREDMHEPLLPEPTPGSRPLFSVYLPHNTTTLTLDNVQLIDPDYRGVPPVTGTKAIAPVVAKLAGTKPVTIVFFGDSITVQPPEDFRDGKGSFVYRFASYLTQRYPKRVVTVITRTVRRQPKPGEVVIVKAGVGGQNTREAMPRLRQDVLNRAPDLVVVMFGVNDESPTDDKTGNEVPVPEYRRNLAEIVAEVRGVGAEPVLMTTSMKNLGWVSTSGDLDRYAAAVRDLAQEQHVCLVDNYQAWRDLPRRGYHYMIYLDSCINHPNDLGHQLFFEGLRAAWEAK